MEVFLHEHGVEIAPDDVVIDKSSLIPAVTLSSRLKERLASNMRFSVVVNLLGKPIGYTILYAKLRQMWDLRGAKVVDMGGGYFLVQYQEAVLEGPWTLLGSYLQVQTWTTAFRVHHSSPLTTAVWIRISELPLLGKVIRVDYNTSDMQRGKFARLAVDVGLTRPLVSKFTIDGEEFKVEYENLQELCFHCGMYGHLRATCAHKPKEADEEGSTGVIEGMVVAPADTYGPWMRVEKKRRQQGKRKNDFGEQESGEAIRGSRFTVLRSTLENIL